DQTIVEAAGLGDLLRLLAIDQYDQVEIAVADMADQRCGEKCAGEIGLGLADAVGEARDRHADIGRESLAAGPKRQRRPERIVSRLPEPATGLGLERPLEIRAAI